MKIFLTGGAGFVGSNLISTALNEGNEITVLDNFSNSSRGKIERFLEKGVKIIEGDITDQKLLQEIVHDFDVVVHLAAKISVQDSIKNPEETIRINVTGTEYIIKACIKSNISNIIVASSAAIFGELENQNEILDETTRPNPVSPYGESKLQMEKKIHELTLANNINSIILRFFNIYGVGQSNEYAGVITKFFEKIKQNKPIEIFGDGKQKRDFIYINDATEAIMKSIKNIDNKKGEIYNIASGKSITILELAKTILKISNKSETEIIFSKPKKNDIKISQTSIEKAKKELSFFTQTELTTGLSKMVENL